RDRNRHDRIRRGGPLMATTRRTFLQGATALGMATVAGTAAAQVPDDARPRGLPAEIIDDDALPRRRPLVVSTWNHGLPANRTAWEVLAGSGALDAVEAGVRVVEADPTVTSVGYGGYPDRDGRVTLDACIMDGDGRAGAVAFLEGIMHPISVARKVMDQTPHVMLVGAGAKRFALDQGFAEQDLLTEEARRAWQEWLVSARYEPKMPPASSANHDTISMLAIDPTGNLAGACTTSGLAFKMHGRVGDSPIIGAALFVDNAVGAACATGVGEEVMKTLGSFLIVELMRQGATPQEACEEAIGRIVARHNDLTDVQVGYLAIDRRGRVGAYDIQPWFQYAVTDADGGTRLVDAASHIPRK
ncbi:MAG: N(4)-(beta-N-acetylglucosaminyl)-L-asparaginase, partial [Synechococcaceae cyanobacterium]|nr:N(4)-(beta-N-acetylglucosaminyl)-L-asparaginase [Synechococcaceae cyanobacterium]